MSRLCPAVRDDLTCSWQEEHNADRGLHFDRVRGTWVEAGSSAEWLMGYLPSQRDGSTTDASTTRRTGSTVRP